jgi:excisionase family DNA binding protein
MNNKIPSYWKVGEVADMFRVNHNSVYKWIERGDLSALRVGNGSIRIADDDLKKFIRQNRS